MQTAENLEAMLADDMGYLWDKPLDFVMYAFPWDTDPSIQLVKLQEPYRSRFDCEYGPDVWACELLDEWGEMIKGNNFDGKHAVSPILMAVSSGHGIGKSTLTAWQILFIMSTRPHAKGIVTSNTSDQLKTKTWAEVGKWRKLSVTGHWFKYSNTKGNMNLRSGHSPDTWRCDAQTCREENSEAFAGLHAANSTPFYIFDEASAVPDKIWEVAEGGTTDGEPMWFVYGNPTRNTGRFRECFRKFRHRWTTRHIDSREVSITNKERLQEWIDDYGEGSDFVKVRVRGVFPSASVYQFIGEDLVEEAFGKHLRVEQYSFAPIIIGVDPAWTGEDEFVIALRQGLYSKILRTYEKNDNDFLMAQEIAELEDEHGADAVFVDLGYGTGVVSAGKTMGRDWHLISFAEKSIDDGCFLKRSEMWNNMKKWLMEGAAIPPDEDLRTDLIGPETVPRADGKIQLEKKADMKKRGLPSPNKADAIALTFARPVIKPTYSSEHGGKKAFCNAGKEYEPYA